jgi:hypothetical protein
MPPVKCAATSLALTVNKLELMAKWNRTITRHWIETILHEHQSARLQPSTMILPPEIPPTRS